MTTTRKPSLGARAQLAGQRFGRRLALFVHRMRVFRRLRLAEGRLLALDTRLAGCCECGCVVLVDHEATAAIEGPVDPFGNQYHACRYCKKEAQKKADNADRKAKSDESRRKRQLKLATEQASGVPN